MDNKGSFIEKKLRGSGGYTVAKINDIEQKMANLGGPELFLAGIGRLEKDRFIKYHCNRCEKDYEGAPNIQYDNPNEDLGENIILIEKGEYKCNACDSVLAQYRKFNDVKENSVYSPNNNAPEVKTDIKEPLEKSGSDNQKTITQSANNNSKTRDSGLEKNYSPIEKIIGLSAYNNNAQLLGKVSEIGLRKISEGKVQFSFKISNNLKKETTEVAWDDIDKIGDIVILHEGFDKSPKLYEDKNNANDRINQNYKICINCNYQNDSEAIFCEECGKKIG
jgi:sporulation protein YlmC with PRC-barrel domain